jgi:hypothetical protein
MASRRQHSEHKQLQSCGNRAHLHGGYRDLEREGNGALYYSLKPFKF